MKAAELSILRNSISDLLIACGAALLCLLVLLLIRHAVRRYHARLSDRSETDLTIELPIAILARTSTSFLLILSLFTGLATLNHDSTTARLARSAAVIALLWQIGIWSTAATNTLIERRRRSTRTDRARAGSLGVIAIVVRMTIWTIVVLMILKNTGVDVTALVAGLGIGGVAVALALQSILGDLFASLSITFDQPFVLGDLLIIENYSGNVEHIGLKSTRLRSLSGEQIIIANADLLRSRVRNYGRMRERRVQFIIGVAYETAADTLARIPAIIAEIVSAQKEALFDRCHFARYADHSLDFEIAYRVLRPEYDRYMDIQQAINISIHREFARTGIQFARPPRTGQGQLPSADPGRL